MKVMKLISTMFLFFLTIVSFAQNEGNDQMSNKAKKALDAIDDKLVPILESIEWKIHEEKVLQKAIERKRNYQIDTIADILQVHYTKVKELAPNAGNAEVKTRWSVIQEYQVEIDSFQAVILQLYAEHKKTKHQQKEEKAKILNQTTGGSHD